MTPNPESNGLTTVLQMVSTVNYQALFVRKRKTKGEYKIKSEYKKFE